MTTYRPIFGMFVKQLKVIISTRIVGHDDFRSLGEQQLSRYLWDRWVVTDL